MATPEKVIKALEDIIDSLNRTTDLMQKRINDLQLQLARKMMEEDRKNKYPKWLWNAIYFLAGIGFWQILIWTL